MVPNRGTEWEYVEQLTPDGANCGKIKCKLCNNKFCRSSAEGPPTSGHFLKIIGHGVPFCEAEDSKLKLVAALSKIDKQSKGESA